MCDHLPAFLSPGRVAAPAVRVKLGIFIGEGRLKGPTMQIQFDHIASGEGRLGQVGEEEFVDDTCSCDPNGTLLIACGMRDHHHTASHLFRPDWNLRTIVEAAHGLTFRALLELIRRQVETRLHQRVIQSGVRSASGHKGEARQVGEYGPRSILSVKPEQGTRRWNLVRREVATDGCQAPPQLLPIVSVAPVPKRAEPLEAMSLTDNRAGSYHLPTFAPWVAGGTDLL